MSELKNEGINAAGEKDIQAEVIEDDALSSNNSENVSDGEEAIDKIQLNDDSELVDNISQSEADLNHQSNIDPLITNESSNDDILIQCEASDGANGQDPVKKDGHLNDLVDSEKKIGAGDEQELFCEQGIKKTIEEEENNCVGNGETNKLPIITDGDNCNNTGSLNNAVVMFETKKHASTQTEAEDLHQDIIQIRIILEELNARMMTLEQKEKAKEPDINILQEEAEPCPESLTENIQQSTTPLLSEQTKLTETCSGALCVFERASHLESHLWWMAVFGLGRYESKIARNPDASNIPLLMQTFKYTLWHLILIAIPFLLGLFAFVLQVVKGCQIIHYLVAAYGLVVLLMYAYFICFSLDQRIWSLLNKIDKSFNARGIVSSSSQNNFNKYLMISCVIFALLTPSLLYMQGCDHFPNSYFICNLINWIFDINLDSTTNVLKQLSTANHGTLFPPIVEWMLWIFEALLGYIIFFYNLLIKDILLMILITLNLNSLRYCDYLKTTGEINLASLEIIKKHYGVLMEFANRFKDELRVLYFLIELEGFLFLCSMIVNFKRMSTCAMLLSLVLVMKTLLRYYFIVECNISKGKIVSRLSSYENDVKELDQTISENKILLQEIQAFISAVTKEKVGARSKFFSVPDGGFFKCTGAISAVVTFFAMLQISVGSLNLYFKNKY